ncbi:hypothetical protein KOW79_012136 [Hemibagrus wyckioides]|uniref:Uncharacterized protein n=1 Tax=Hemibagrus wyckioides TaxID=337641 RepID=A0A9D3NNB3_9TELE|nr:hypothetical protein KOW79_012136 [Hemibagrus wyckioides]
MQLLRGSGTVFGDVIRIRTEMENELEHTVSQLHKGLLCSESRLETRREEALREGSSPLRSYTLVMQFGMRLSSSSIVNNRDSLRPGHVGLEKPLVIPMSHGHMRHVTERPAQLQKPGHGEEEEYECLPFSRAAQRCWLCCHKGRHYSRSSLLAEKAV